MCNQNNYNNLNKRVLQNLTMLNYFTIRGGSLKNIAKKIIPRVPTSKKV